MTMTVHADQYMERNRDNDNADFQGFKLGEGSKKEIRQIGVMKSNKTLGRSDACLREMQAQPPTRCPFAPLSCSLLSQAQTHHLALLSPPHPFSRATLSRQLRSASSSGQLPPPKRKIIV
eukprot:1158312-Pelagomonas_calceolata.AAC.1